LPRTDAQRRRRRLSCQADAKRFQRIQVAALDQKATVAERPSVNRSTAVVAIQVSKLLDSESSFGLI